MGGWRRIGRDACVICSIEGAGVVAVAVAAEACRHCQQTYCGAGLMESRSCFAAGWRRSLGAMLGYCGCGWMRCIRRSSSRVVDKHCERRAIQCFPIAQRSTSLAHPRRVKSQEVWTGRDVWHFRCGFCNAAIVSLRLTPRPERLASSNAFQSSDIRPSVLI